VALISAVLLAIGTAVGIAVGIQRILDAHPKLVVRADYILHRLGERTLNLKTVTVRVTNRRSVPVVLVEIAYHWKNGATGAVRDIRPIKATLGKGDYWEDEMGVGYYWNLALISILDSTGRRWKVPRRQMRRIREEPKD
jgi:hypothetical protein